MWENLTKIQIPYYNVSININLSTYPHLQNFTNLSNVEQFFTPVYWWTDVLGNWFYTFILYVTVGMVFLKTKSIFAAALVLLLLSSVMVALIPHEAGLVVYLSLVLALFGVLYKLLRGESI